MIFKNKKLRFIYLLATVLGIGFVSFVGVVAYTCGLSTGVAEGYYDCLETTDVFVEETDVADVPLPTDIIDYQFAHDVEQESAFWAAPHPNARVLKSGVAILNLDAVTDGMTPGPSDHVEVDYRGWTTDGNEFDSSYKRNMPTKFRVNATIPGFAEALQNMRVGETIRVWIPEKLAYKGRPGPPKGVLIFDIKLHSFEMVPSFK